MAGFKAEPLGVPHVATTSRGDRRARVSGLDRWLSRKMLEAAGNPPVAVELWNGERLEPGTAPAIATLRIADRWVLPKLLSYPELHFGDLYSQGRLDVAGDLVAFLVATYTAMGAGKTVGFARRQALRLRHRWRSATVARARENIHHHYDLGNDFYELWLDSQLQYTCAYYPRSGMSLEEAQTAKMHHVCRKAGLRPGQTVVEPGSGWGGLALFMARHYGVSVRAYNTSHEQIVYAREWARRENLTESVEFVEDDYRNIRGCYDAFVSVGMLEHVGLDHYGELGEVIQRSLAPGGRGLIHSIGRARPGPMNPWIARRIFPGAHPPTLTEMMRVFEPRALAVLDVENLRLHYARTLEHWLARFQAHEDRIRSLFDERFVRAWRLYLAGSIAAFLAGSLHLYQVTFARSRDNDVPWTREHLYRDADRVATE